MIHAELVLIDSSVWLEVLLSRSGAEALVQRVNQLIAAEAAATTALVKVELLRGARSDADWQRLSALVSALEYLPVTEGIWDQAAQLGYQLKRAGVTVPTPDLIIATVAIAENATLLHRDRHFDLMAAHVPLKVESAV